MSSSPVRPSPSAGGSSPMRFSSPARGSVRGTPRSATSQVPRTPSSVVGTPQRAPAAAPPAGSPSSGTGPRRGDIGSSRGFARPRGMDSDEKGVLSTDAMPAGSVLWGTSVNVHSSMKAIEKFFLSFKEDGQREPKYPRLLQEMIESNTYNINVDCSNLAAFDRQLYRELVSYPSELVPLFDLVIHEIITKKFPDVAAERTRRTQVRTFNLLEIQNMRELNPVDIDKMIAIKGMVIRASSIIPDLRTAFFQCTMCNNTLQVGVDRGRIQQPTQCANCRTDNTLQPIHNRGFFADKQLIKIQETPDTVPEGETPHTVNVFAFDDLVDVVKPGDRVEITGIYKARAVRMNPRKRNVLSVYSTYVDAIHFKRTEKGRVGSEHPSADPNSEFYTSFDESDAVRAFSAAEEKKLRALAESGDVYDKLTRSVAPSIYQLEDVKKGILCQLFGGANKEITGHGRFRGELNVLLCGDPGTSKSQMLQYVHKLAPRGIYTSGKGNSAVGLTAYITKDNDTGELVLESGALVLSDRGICCIDEFDKMSDSTRSVLHEVMEQQTVSIAKAGIVCSLNARTAILASANPKGSRYNPKLSVVDNIMLPPTLLSRFDLIYLILDNPNELSDRRLARHLVSLYYDEADRDTRRDADLIPTDLLSKYISFARRTVQPVIGDDAVEDLINGYVEMRRVGQHNAYRKVVTATPRQLESLIRLSEALARMRLSDRVGKHDVQEARRLMNVATQSAATDPTTGLIDMDLITTGHSAAERKRTEDQIAALKDLFEGLSGSIKYPALLKRFNDNTSGMEIDMQQLRQITEILLSEGYLITHGRDALKRAT